VIIVNLEGVLPVQSGLKLQQTIAALDKLSRQASVYVISQKGKDKIHDMFASGAPRLGLAAENGFFYRPNSEGKSVE
jgi:trehalose-6-phosphatase